MRNENYTLQAYGKTPVFQDLPSQLVPALLHYLDYVDQQRVTRVCKLWQHKISTEIDHVYLDWPAVDTKRRHGDYRIFHNYYGLNIDRLGSPINSDNGKRPELPAWKKKSNFIRHLTIHGGYQCNFHRSFADIIKLTKQFPNLEEIVINQLALDQPGTSLYEFVEHWGGRTGIKLKVVDCVVSMISSPYYLFPQPAPRIAQGLLGDRGATCVAIADVVFADADQLKEHLHGDNRVWPYPKEQIIWLRLNACWLNDFAIIPLRSIQSFFPSYRFLCPQHDQLCDHLEQSIYDGLPCRLRNVLVSLLLHLNLLQVPEPPVPFLFKLLQNGPELGGSRNLVAFDT